MADRAETTGWRPMNEAPHDGTRVLLLVPTQDDGEPVQIAAWKPWNGDAMLWVTDQGEGWGEAGCAAWQPLPEALAE